MIHPQWDNIGSPTLFIKILFCNYEKKFAVIELLGEWNDAIHNDIMFLKRDIIDHLIGEGIVKFLIIGENILNYHRSETDYYEEWLSDIQDENGWIVALNFQEHVIQEMRKGLLHHYIFMGEAYNDFNWRKQNPFNLHKIIDELIVKAIE